MTAILLALLALAAPAWPGAQAHAAPAGSSVGLRLIELRGDPAPGLLVNRTVGLRPFDPPDPSRPTIVIVHGINPAPWAWRYPIAERLGEALAARGDAPRNAMGWEWNGETLVGLHPRANHDQAVEQGRRLAGALLAAGLAPERVHLIGQSSGAIVATTAARAILDGTGRAVGQLTLIDPAVTYHDLVFRRLAAGSCAHRVDHFWAPGPTGFSRATGAAGVVETAVAPLGGLRSSTDPARTAHLNAVRWYLGTAADPSAPGGFNASLFAH